jgi:LPS-assembly lipoprotein
MMNTGLTRWLLLPLLGLWLTGCGFHMRGDLDIPPEYMKVQLKGDNKSDLYRLVANRLQRVGVQLVPGGENVPQLTLGNIQVTNQAVSVDSRSQAVEYNMQFNTEYSIVMPEHEPQKFNASFSRTFLNKSSEALASSREQEQRTREMQEQTADLILIQLSRLKY